MGKLPEFLRNYDVPLGFKATWTRRMTGWVALHAAIKAHKTKTAAFYARLLIIELDRVDPRPDIVTRLHGGFSVRRKREELMNLMKLIR